MTRHAGFALVVSLTEDCVNGILGSYHANLAAPIQIGLPSVVPVGSQQLPVGGTLTLLPPKVTLRARADDLIAIEFGVAGLVSVGGGPSGVPLEEALIIVSTSADVGVTTGISNDRMIVGIDTTQATVGPISFSALTGQPLSSLVSSVLGSPAVLGALTAGLRAIPPSLLQLTVPTFKPSFAVTVPNPMPQRTDYWEGNGPVSPPPLPPPRNWFSFDIPLSRVVVRPLDEALVVAVDVQGYTTGDGSALVDLNRAPAPQRYTLSQRQDDTWQFSGGFEPGAPLHPHNSSIASVINANLLSGVMAREVSPQMSGTFVDRHVKLTSIALRLGKFQAGWTPHSDPTQTRFGLIVEAGATYHSHTWTGLSGYPEPALDADDEAIDATVTIGSIIELATYDGSTNYVAGHPDTYLTEVVSTDIELPWWLTPGIILVSMLFPGVGFVAAVEILGGIIPGILENAEEQVRQQVANGIAGAMANFPINRAQTSAPLPGTQAPHWAFVVNDIVVSDEGIESYTTAHADLELPFLLNIAQVITDPQVVTEANASRSPALQSIYHLEPVSFVLKIPPGLFHPLDPTILATWEVTRIDTGEVILSKEHALSDLTVLGAAEVLVAVVDPTLESLKSVDEIDVHCRLRRAKGGGNNDETIVDLHSSLGIADWLDRHHPFVQWHHVTPVYAGLPAAHLQPEPPDPKKRWSRNRTSKIHRTAFPGRCLAEIGKRATREFPPRQYLDTLDGLPNGITLDQIRKDRNLARGILCDYCFYGGPTKTTLLL